MIKLNRIFIILSIALSVTLCKATIISMEELYNPQLNQTVILAGDLHTTLEVEAEQLNNLIMKAQECKAMFLCESNATITNWVRQTAAQTLALLANIEKSCKEHGINCIEIDYRIWLGQLDFVIGYLEANIDQFNSLKDDLVIKNIHRSFKYALSDTKQKINDFNNYLIDLESGKINDAHQAKLIPHLKNTLPELKVAMDEIVAKLPPDKETPEEQMLSIANFVLDDIFIKDESGKFSKDNANIVVQELHPINLSLIDMCALQQILTNQNQRVIFVCAGALHTQKIAAVLKTMGYSPKTAKINDLTEVVNHFGRIYDEKGRHEALWNSPELAQYAIDVAKFFEQCSSLPLDVSYTQETLQSVKKLSMQEGLETAGQLV